MTLTNSFTLSGETVVVGVVKLCLVALSLFQSH